MLTYHAPPERADDAQVRAARAVLMAEPLAVGMLEVMPDPVLVLNAQRQIIACNPPMLRLAGLESPEPLLGLRPGEAAGCLYCDDGPAGCGTGRYCVVCGAVNAIVECFDSHQPTSRECRLRIHAGPTSMALDLLVQASFLQAQEHDLAFVVLRDIGAEKRRQVLERVFFHDVLNTVSKISSLAYLLAESDPDPQSEADYKRYLRQLAEEIGEEIHAQRALLAAEQGDLRVRPVELEVADLMQEVAASYRHHELARERSLQIGPISAGSIRTDRTLLRRALGNLVKNALEATPVGGAVTVSAETRGGEVSLLVHNPGFIPELIQRQIFQRSFSTKEGEGRGIGTHSVKLFTERYLGGRVSFRSSETEGTTFVVVLPGEPTSAS
jgi:signal transduction histidine kinase